MATILNFCFLRMSVYSQAKYVQLRVLRGVKDANPRDPAIIWPNWGRGNPGLLEALEDYTAPPDPLCLNYDEY